MGNCLPKSSSARAAANNAKIDQYLAQQALKKDHKLLLLGTGESGKSTIFKQLQLLSGQAYTKEDAEEAIPLVFKNVFENFLVLLNAFSLPAVQEKMASSISLSEEDDQARTAFIQKYTKDSQLTKESADEIKYLWNLPAIQETWRLRAEYQIMDVLSYYIAEIDRLAREEYTPTQLDILSARVRTSGILEHVFVADDQKFTVIDVGGQKNERKKWIHCFDGVTGIIFVAAINEYDQVLFEDKKTSRISDALKVFKALLKNSLFVETPIILILNKNDLFEKKVLETPLRAIDGVPGEEFTGPFAGDEGVTDQQAIAAAKQWMQNLFLKNNPNPNREIHTIFTTALDNKSIARFFDATKDILEKA